MKNFKIGDRVILVDAAGIFTLEMYQSYEVVDIEHNKFYTNREQFIRVKDSEDFYNSRRFKKDVKFVRRKKIEKLKWKNYDISNLELKKSRKLKLKTLKQNYDRI